MDDKRHELNDTWVWDGSQWSNADPPGDLPEARFWAGMDFDPASERLMLFAGLKHNSTGGPEQGADSPWAWNGERWSKVAPAEFDWVYLNKELSSDEAKRALLVAQDAGAGIWLPKATPSPENGK